MISPRASFFLVADNLSPPQTFYLMFASFYGLFAHFYESETR